MVRSLPAAFIALALSAAVAHGQQQDAGAYYNYGQQLFQQGNNAEALRYLVYAVQLDQQHWQAWQALGYVYEQLGQRDESLKAIQNSLAINPSNPPLEAFFARLKSGEVAAKPTPARRCRGSRGGRWPSASGKRPVNSR